MSCPDSKAEIAPALRDKIAAEHAAAIGAAESAVEHAINCGRYLSEAKAALPHGLFIAYVEENFEFTRQTASGYMRLAAAADSGQLEDASSIRGALKQLAAPPASREDAEPVDGRLTQLEEIIGPGLDRFPEFAEELEEAERLIAKGDALGAKEAWDLGEKMDALREKIVAAMTPFDRYWLRHKGFATEEAKRSIEETCEIAGMRPMFEDVGERYVWVGFAPASEDGGIENPLTYHSGWASYCREVLGDDVAFATEDLMPPHPTDAVDRAGTVVIREGN